VGLGRSAGLACRGHFSYGQPVTLRQLDEPPGPPWQRPLAGTFDQLVVESEALAGNPLGDPMRRPLYVYSTPRVAAGQVTDVPAVYVLQGFSGQLDGWLARKSFEPTFVERLDAALADDSPDAIIVFVDAWTSLGGAQFLNSTATGDYSDYLCDEVVPFVDARYATSPAVRRRAVAGHSSGGYGALVLPMLRPDVFGALVASAPDSLFEYCYLPDIAKAFRALRDHYGGSYEALRADVAAADSFDWDRWAEAVNMYAMAAAYSPDPAHPDRPQLPFDLRSGRVIPEVWERWLAHDPVRMVPGHAQQLRGLAHIYLMAGRSDEFLLDVGSSAFGHELEQLGIEYTLELVAGGHGGMSSRFPGAIRNLLLKLEDLED
jgi:S-formylglutathione hydrolase FrmB